MNSTTNGIHPNHLAIGASPSASCPACGSEIPRSKYEAILRINEARQKQLSEEQATLERERADVTRKRQNIEAAAVESARVKWASEMSAAQLAAERDRDRLARAHTKSIEAEIRKREELEKQLARERARAEAKAKATAEAQVREATRTAERKKDLVIDELRVQLKTSEQRRRRDEDVLKKTISELQEKANARDRAHFGPEGEEDLVQMLRAQFPADHIEHRGKKGDVLQSVLDAGRSVGTIVYEVKKTKGWERAYLRQMKLAMEGHGTRYGILVSKTLPSRRSGLVVLDSVIVVEPAFAVQVVPILRDAIIGMSRLKVSEEGKSAKVVELFEYLRGDEFSGAVQIVNDKIRELRESLSRERSFHDGWWRTREQHYGAILRETTGVHARVSDILSRRDVARPKVLVDRTRRKSA